MDAPEIQTSRQLDFDLLVDVCLFVVQLWSCYALVAPLQQDVQEAL